jgi:peptide-methionine (S)-S-oxide reductase
VYSSKIVTQVVPLKAFYPAEDYHQNYLVHNTTQPYIVIWDLPKLAALEKQYPQLVRPEA